MVGLLLIFGLVFVSPINGLPPKPADVALYTLGQMMLAAITIFLMVKLSIFNKEDFKSGNLGRGLLLGWVTYVTVIGTVVISISSYSADSFIMPNIPGLLISVLHPLIGTGLFEEVLFRGLV